MTKIRLLLSGLLLLTGISVHSQTKHYVRPTFSGSHTGKNWATAFDNLQTAIDSAKAGDSIFVRWGLYSPTNIAGTGSTPRHKAFILKNDVKMYGGFAGIETSLAERDNAFVLGGNITNLSGEFGGPDSADNAYHIVLALKLSANTVLNGFGIFRGCANGTGSNMVNGTEVVNNRGGGIYSDSSQLKMEYLKIYSNASNNAGAGMYNTNKSNSIIINSQIINNTIRTLDSVSGGGAGVFNLNSSPDFSDVIINGNRADSINAGGVRNENSNAHFTNVTLRSNVSNDFGGAMVNKNSNVILSKLIFQDNMGKHGVGGLSNDSNSNGTMTDIQFINNSTLGNAGAMRIMNSHPKLMNILFRGNTATGSGGAIYNTVNASPEITNCTFISNKCDYYGGAFCNRANSNPIITNSLFAKNIAGHSGGGIYNASATTTGADPSNPVMTNLTIVNNTAGYTGGGGYDDGFGKPVLRNSIVQGNHGYIIDDIDALPATVASAVFNDIIGDEFYKTGTSIPSLITGATFTDTLAGDFRLLAGGPAIDMGDSSFFQASATPDLSSITGDIRYEQRIMGSNIDLGAYESCASILPMSVSVASASGTGVASGASVTFVAATTSAGMKPVFTWRKNGTVIAGVTGKTYTAIAGTDFISGDIITAAIKAISDCATTDTANSNSVNMTVFPVGITNVNAEIKELRLFPNPNEGNFSVEGNFVTGERYQIAVNDITGRTVYQENFVADANSKSRKINLNQTVQAGVYFLCVKSEQQNKQVIRFVVK